MKSRLAVFCFILVLVSAVVPCGAEEYRSGIETKVLRIFVTRDSPYYHKPWKTPDFSNARSSGFFFKDDKNFPGKRGLILTNAHAVAMSQSIKISNGREKQRYGAKLLGVCNTADFAVLEMEPSELDAYEKRNGTVVPLELGDSDTLRVGDKVQGWGYPLGGERISKSEQGEISRIEINRYAYSQDQWLMIQASLQQNRGNSGGPVLKDDKVVGISFQGMRTTDRINYFIPINIVKNLAPVLKDQEQIPNWRFIVQQLFPRLKEYYNLGPEDGGILLDYVIPDDGPYKFGLRQGDILVSIDGCEIDNFGEIFFEPLDQRIYFGEVLNRKKVGDPLSVKVIRRGKLTEITGKITPGLPKLVPNIFTKANYFIFGGIGFIELTQNCIENLGKSGETFKAKYGDEYAKRPYEKIVIISEIFPEYGLVDTASYLTRVTKIDDQEVLNLAGFYETIQNLVKQGKKKALLEVFPNMMLPLDLETAAELDKGIKEKYGILYMKTPDGFSY